MASTVVFEEQVEIPLDLRSLAEFRRWALERMLESQAADLESYGVRFDRWCRESELHAAGALASALAELERKCRIFGQGCLKHGQPELGKRFLAYPARCQTDPTED